MSDESPISFVCITLCTCDRLVQLGHLLQTLCDHSHPRHIPIYIADNGRQSAAAIVAHFSGRLTLHHARVNEPGLTPVRNTVLDMAVAAGHSFIAFIDDNNVPAPGWLDALVTTAHAKSADIVTGPVRPILDDAMPRWLRDAGVLGKEAHVFGTNNMLLRRTILPFDRADWFHPRFSRIGGEDRELYHRLERDGARLVPCPDAVVYEHVPEACRRLGYFYGQGLRGGALETEIYLHHGGVRWRRWPRFLGMALTKTGHAIAHLVSAPFATGHLVRAVRDLGFASGLVQSLCGRRFAFYETDTDGIPT